MILSIVTYAIFMTTSLPSILYFLGRWKGLKVSLIASYAYINTFRLFYLVQFSLASFAVRLRFKALNEKIKEQFLTKLSSNCFKALDVKSSDIFKLGNVFHKLCDAIEIINETFTFHFVLLFMVILVSCN